MAHKRRHGNKWEYVVKRKLLLPKAVTYRFDDEAEGDAFCARLERLLDNGIVPQELLGESRASTLHNVIDEYLSAMPVKEEDVGLLRLWTQATAATLPVLNIDFSWCQDRVTALKREANLAPGTIKKRMGALSRCLRWCVARKWLLSDPILLLPRGYARYSDADELAVLELGLTAKEDEHRDRRLGIDEDQTILRALEARICVGDVAAQHEERALQLLFVAGLESAMRMRETYTLTRGQVVLPTRTIFLEKTKNGSKRQVPMSSTSVTAFTDFFQWHEKHVGPLADTSHVFPWLTAPKPTKAELKAITAKLSARFARFFEKCGCVDLTFHDLRHEAISRLFERTNLSDAQIMKVSGHSSYRMLNRYANLRGSDLANALW